MLIYRQLARDKITGRWWNNKFPLFLGHSRLGASSSVMLVLSPKERKRAFPQEVARMEHCGASSSEAVQPGAGETLCLLMLTLEAGRTHD